MLPTSRMCERPGGRRGGANAIPVCPVDGDDDWPADDDGSAWTGDGDLARPRPGCAGGAGRCRERHRDECGDRFHPRRADVERRQLPAGEPATGDARPDDRGTRLCHRDPPRAVARSGADAGRGRRSGRGRRAGDARGVGGNRRRGHLAVGGRRRHSLDGHRGPAAQRPQLPRTGAAGPGQCARTQLRPHQVELGRHLLGGPARSRRQHHHRRRRQQRRCRWRTAAERHPGVGAGVPDRDPAVHGRIGAVGLVGHQRGDPLGHRPAARIVLVLRARQRVAGAAGHLRSIERRLVPLRSPAGGWRRRRSAGVGQGVLVRGRRVPQPGRRGAGGRA